MKKTIIIALALLATAFTVRAQEPAVTQLTYGDFIKKIWNIESNPRTFSYRGSLPAVIDFYADWCGPCRRVAPIMEELAQKYDGQVLFYKVNVDQERGLASTFQVQSIPMVLFIPMDGQPSKQVGAMSKEDYIRFIEDRLLK